MIEFDPDWELEWEVGPDVEIEFLGGEVLAFTGTCQSCGMYWDVRNQPVCPCGGEVL